MKKWSKILIAFVVRFTAIGQSDIGEQLRAALTEEELPEEDAMGNNIK